MICMPVELYYYYFINLLLARIFIDDQTPRRQLVRSTISLLPEVRRRFVLAIHSKEFKVSAPVVRASHLSFADKQRCYY